MSCFIILKFKTSVWPKKKNSNYKTKGKCGNLFTIQKQRLISLVSWRCFVKNFYKSIRKDKQHSTVSKGYERAGILVTHSFHLKAYFGSLQSKCRKKGLNYLYMWIQRQWPYIGALRLALFWMSEFSWLAEWLCLQGAWQNLLRNSSS